jgi:hypothetical protein
MCRRVASAAITAATDGIVNESNPALLAQPPGVTSGTTRMSKWAARSRLDDQRPLPGIGSEGGPMGGCGNV